LLRHVIAKYGFAFTADEVDFICEMINPKTRPKRPLKHRIHRPDFFFQIVSNYINGFDGDKIDYLMRDTDSIGIKHAVEYQGLFNEARVIDNIICFPKDQVLNVYEVYQLRYKMHKTYYMNKITNLYEYMILDLLKEVDEELQISHQVTDIEAFCSYTDELIERIKYTTKSQKALQIIRNIESRNTYIFVKEILHTGKNEDVANKIVAVKSFCKKHGVEDILIVNNFHINFNMKNKNPVDSIHFYDPNEPMVKFTIARKEVSLILPNVFEELITRVIIRSDPEITVKGVTKTLKQYIEDIVG
jgi:HD superfamily phosphohydrolase